MRFTKLLKCIVFINFFGAATLSAAPQTELQKLDFMIGEWVGISTSFDKAGNSKSIPVKQYIKFELNGGVINIFASSPALSLQTIIGYDETRSEYFYHPYTQDSYGQASGSIKDGKFFVYLSNSQRLIFEPTQEGLRETGEKLSAGKWIKYFQDNLYPPEAFDIK